MKSAENYFWLCVLLVVLITSGFGIFQGIISIFSFFIFFLFIFDPVSFFEKDKDGKLRLKIKYTDDENEDFK